MNKSNELIENVDLAWDMAIAENPYHELASYAAIHGMMDVVSLLKEQANQTSDIIRDNYLESLRQTKLKEIRDASEYPVVDFVSFSLINSNSENSWTDLKDVVSEFDDIPLEFVPIDDEVFVLTGNFRSAARSLRGSSSGQILDRIADIYAMH